MSVCIVGSNKKNSMHKIRSSIKKTFVFGKFSPCSHISQRKRILRKKFRIIYSINHSLFNRFLFFFFLFFLKNKSNSFIYLSSGSYKPDFFDRIKVVTPVSKAIVLNFIHKPFCHLSELGSISDFSL